MAKKILLVSQEKVHAATNGATKILYYFANSMSKRGYDVIVIYPTKENPTVDPKLDKSIKFYNLDYLDIGDFKSKRKRFNLKELFIKIRCKKSLDHLRWSELSDKIEYIVEKEQPDVIIPFFAHVTSQIVFGKKYDIPILQMYHTHPKVYHAKANILNPNSKDMAIVFNHTVKQVSILQLFFDSYADYLRPYFKGRTRIIHNPVIIPNEQVNLEETKRKIIYLSRIDKNKGQDILIEAFALIAKQYPEWEVLLYGDFEPASYQKHINSLINKHDLGRQVKIMGVTSNPNEAFMNADIGAYTSTFEGFPLGLSEALAIGLPCIGLSCATGINELIKDRENGLLTESNQVDVARKLTELMNNQPLRQKYGQNARESMKKYSEELFFAKWDAMIDDAISEFTQKKH